MHYPKWTICKWDNIIYADITNQALVIMLQYTTNCMPTQDKPNRMKRILDLNSETKDYLSKGIFFLMIATIWITKDFDCPAIFELDFSWSDLTFLLVALHLYENFGSISFSSRHYIDK